MAATAKPLIPATEPASPLERLHADRAGLTSEGGRLAGVLTRLQAEAAAGASLDAELAKLAAAETDDMKVWAAGGCVGAAPKGKQTERQAIALKMAGTNAAAAAATAAMHDVNHQINQINDKLRDIGAQIERAALDQMQAELDDIRAEHLAAIERVRKSSAKMFGMCTFLSNEGRRLIDHGDVEGGKRYFARAEKLNELKLPSSGVTQGEIIQAASNWSTRAAALRSGSAT